MVRDGTVISNLVRVGTQNFFWYALKNLFALALVWMHVLAFNVTIKSLPSKIQNTYEVLNKLKFSFSQVQPTMDKFLRPIDSTTNVLPASLSGKKRTQEQLDISTESDNPPNKKQKTNHNATSIQSLSNTPSVQSLPNTQSLSPITPIIPNLPTPQNMAPITPIHNLTNTFRNHNIATPSILIQQNLSI